jgi:uncharacterized pyridoxal phosphate-dependent enzyme
MKQTADPLAAWELTRVINAAGTMTSIGASRAAPEIVDRVSTIMRRFVSMAEFQSKASDIIAAATGSEAGCVTNCSAGGITQCVAAAITRLDLAAIERLPDVGTREARVAIQMGHMINYGAPIPQCIALAGAQVVPLGTAACCETFHLRDALEKGCAAAVFVVSHHTVREGELPLDVLIELCHRHEVPVIVDMAAEYDLRTPIAQGADLVVYSGHKFLGGSTSGIVAGDRDLVRAVYLQHRGIGRCMKAGKESVAGVIAALELWGKRDGSEMRRREDSIVAAWKSKLADIPGLVCTLHDDWTGNPITRLKLTIAPSEAGIYAWELASRLARRDLRIVVRDDLAEHSELYLDPCNIEDDETELVSSAIRDELAKAREANDGLRMSWSDVKRRSEESILAWPVGRRKDTSA